MAKSNPKSRSFCMAPWTHSYLSPLGERNLCCLSNDQSEFVTRRTVDESGRSLNTDATLVPLEEFWNSPHMKDIRRRMLAGDPVPECAICHRTKDDGNNYRVHFNDRFNDLFPEVLKSTEADGFTTLKPISLDYRISNICNFKCRMCSPRFSSALEKEAARYSNYQISSQIREFLRETARPELFRITQEGSLKEIIWAGGEPLLLKDHWEIMTSLVRSGESKNIRIRYTTNLSTLRWKNLTLIDDILPHFKEVFITASVDGPGRVGEYLRSGFNWNLWKKNYQEVLNACGATVQAAMDVTVTLPGLVGMVELMEYAEKVNSPMIAKPVGVNPKNFLLSPFALPAEVLKNVVDDIVIRSKGFSNRTLPLIGVLKSLTEGTSVYDSHGPSQAKILCLSSWLYLKELERRRQPKFNGGTTLEEIFSLNPFLKSWWQKISQNSFDSLTSEASP